MFIITGAYSQYDFEWSKSFGGDSSEASPFISCDNDGNIFMVAGFVGTATFGSFTFTSYSNFCNGVILKINPDGNIEWVKQIQSFGDVQINNIIFDNNDNFFISGFYLNKTIFDTDTIESIGWYNFFIAKYNNDGMLQWVKHGGWSTTSISKIAIDYEDNILFSVIGRSDTLLYENDTLIAYNTIDTNACLFLFKINSNGNLIWAKEPIKIETVPSPCGNICVITCISTDSLNNIYLAGTFHGCNIIIGTDTFLGKNYYLTFIAKFDSSGNFVWAKQSNGIQSQPRDIISDKSGNTYLIGRFIGTLIFDTDSVVTTPTGDALFIGKFNTNGNVQWLKKANGFLPSRMTKDENENFYITGFSHGGAQFDSITVIPDYIISIHSFAILVKYNSNGNAEFAKYIKGVEGYDLMGNPINCDNYGTGVCIGNNQNLFFSGTYRYKVVIGSDTLINHDTTNVVGDTDIFITKLSFTTGITNFYAKDDIIVYPNPATDKITIGNLNKASKYIISDVLGNTIYKANIDNPDAPEIRINLSGLNPGVYIIQIFDEKNNIYYKKIIKQ